MTFPIITKKEEIKKFGIGAKATNLFRLKEMGINVPQFIVIPKDVLREILPSEVWSLERKDIVNFIEQIYIAQTTIDDILSKFQDTIYFAVRSSAIDEDDSSFSFAGQFDSYLFVTKDDLADKIKKVWSSLFAERVIEYRKNNNLESKLDIAVIIQEMVYADTSGVAFGVNPVTGNQTEKVINSVYGLGEGLMSGKYNADLYYINNKLITKQVTTKTHKIELNSISNKGTIEVEVEEEKQNLSSLNDNQIYELEIILNKLYQESKAPQDIEFAIKKDIISVLQARPVTAFKMAKSTNDSYIVWDNSNIIESYPGVTTPLTFSFISQSYYGAYKLFCGYMGVSRKVLNANDRVFANTLGLINGRVYYNLKSWYHMLAMVPGYSINARFMESMMGVDESFDVPESYRLSKGKAFLQIIQMVIQMYLRFLSLPQKRKQFYALLETTISYYKKINFKEKNGYELMKLYLRFESTLLNEWKAPLINDFFAMIMYGRLQKLSKKYAFSSNPNIHNDLLCGSNDIISTQPIHRCITISTMISENSKLREIFISENENDIWKKLSDPDSKNYTLIKKEIDQYLEDFGERCIGELKLETVSYLQEPSKFIKILKSYVETDITISSTSNKIEEKIRTVAELELETALKYKLFKKWKLKRSLKLARELVSARENLRYERTRAFGIVREIFSAIGHSFYKEKILEHPRDIFYLTKEEIFSFIEGTSVTQNIEGLISLRKTEFESYKKLEIPSKRFSTSEIVYHSNDFFSADKIKVTYGDLNGIGCCPGKVQAKVKVILDPNEVSSLNGDILVASSTDPGWVTLFPGAAGIITERGSVLSHSAIVSREMGKPCIVGVSGLLKILKTGDEVMMDGSTGVIKIISK